jgi:hypothetical protein
MGLSASRPSYVPESLERKRKSPAFPAFETEDVSAASNNKRARRRRSNEDDSPFPTMTPPLHENMEAFEDTQQVPDRVIADHRKDYPSLRGSNKESPPISILKPVTPRLHEPKETFEVTTSTEVGPTVAAPLPPGTITKTKITTTTVTTTAITTPDGKTTTNASTTSNTTNLIGRAAVPSASESVIRPCGIQTLFTSTRDQETSAEAQISPPPFSLNQTTNGTQAIDDQPTPPIAKAGSAAPKPVEQATTDALTVKYARRNSTASEDGTFPPFEDRIAELREYYDEHGHTSVPARYVGGRTKNLGQWVKGIRNVYRRGLKDPSTLGEESHGIVLGSNKLSKIRIEGLEAMGFEWLVRHRNVNLSFEDRIADLQEYYDEHGHVRVLQEWKGRTKNLGQWVKGIREVYQRCLKYPFLMDEESPGSVSGPKKLNKVRIERLQAMGLDLAPRQRAERSKTCA